MLYCITQITVTISKAIAHSGQCPDVLDISLRKRIWMCLKESNGHGKNNRHVCCTVTLWETGLPWLLKCIRGHMS